jgi:hypothetical protein
MPPDLEANVIMLSYKAKVAVIHSVHGEARLEGKCLFC